MIKEIKKRGVKIISYFIGGRYDFDEKGTFTKMYGSDAEYIDVTSVLPVAKQ